MVTVPLVCSDVPALRRDAVVAYMPDLFTKPNRLWPDVIFDTTSYFEQVVSMLDCHRSQVYEWLPYNAGIIDQVPDDEAGRREWLANWFAQRASAVADHFRERLIEAYGADVGENIKSAEAYEISEYAAGLGDEKLRLFPGGR